LNPQPERSLTAQSAMATPPWAATNDRLNVKLAGLLPLAIRTRTACRRILPVRRRCDQTGLAVPTHTNSFLPAQPDASSRAVRFRLCQPCGHPPPPARPDDHNAGRRNVHQRVPLHDGQRRSVNRMANERSIRRGVRTHTLFENCRVSHTAASAKTLQPCWQQAVYWGVPGGAVPEPKADRSRRSLRWILVTQSLASSFSPSSTQCFSISRCSRTSLAFQC